MELLNASVTPVTVSLLERLREKENFWAPHGYKDVSSHNTRGRITQGQDLLISSCPDELVQKQEDTSWQQNQDAHLLRKSDYTLYRLEAELLMTPPMTSNSSELKSFNFCLSTLTEIVVDDNLKSMMRLDKITGMGRVQMGI